MVKNIVFLKRDIIDNKNLTNEGIMVYTALVIASENKIDRLFTTVNSIEVILKMKFDDSDRYFKDKTKRGLLNLAENKIIELHHDGEDFKPNEPIVIKLNNFRIDNQKDRFIIADIKDIVKIIRYKEKKFENEKLLSYYFAILSTINNSSKCGYSTIEALSDISGINVTTATTKYNKLLEEMKIIYIHRHNKSYKCYDGTIRKTNNTYGRYSDKEHIISNAESYIQEINRIESTSMITGDRARSIKQKYNHLMKKIESGYIPNEEEVDNLNKDIELYNTNYKYDETIIKLTPISTSV